MSWPGSIRAAVFLPAAGKPPSFRPEPPFARISGSLSMRTSDVSAKIAPFVDRMPSCRAFEGTIMTDFEKEHDWLDAMMMGRARISDAGSGPLQMSNASWRETPSPLQ
jgi:hypothetical protein